MIQNALVTNVGLRTSGGTRDMAMPSGARTVTAIDLNEIAIALTRSGPEMRIGESGRVATKQRKRNVSLER